MVTRPRTLLWILPAVTKERADWTKVPENWETTWLEACSAWVSSQAAVFCARPSLTTTTFMFAVNP